jgi:hypothetical protein
MDFKIRRLFMDRCPYCGKNMYRNSSRQLFFGFGGGPFLWGFPGWGWGWGWGWGHHHHGDFD